MFSKESFKKHSEKKYNFIHVGLIQVAVKPLTHRGINASLLLCLRDARFRDYSTSMLGILESSLHNGTIHFFFFYCFSDFTLSLHDPHFLKALTLNVKTSDYEMLKGSQPLGLIYRIYYKCIRTNLNVHALVKSPKDKTLFNSNKY